MIQPYFTALIPIANGVYIKSQTHSVYKTPWTPITQLVDAIYQQHPHIAFKILRQRITTNYNLTPICKETLKVAAKRYLVDATFLPANTIQTPLEKPSVCSDFLIYKNKTVSINSAKQILLELKSRSEKNTIFAMAISPESQVLSLQKNTPLQGRHLHAEVQLCRDYFLRTQKLFPSGTQFVTTLQPCRMCAAHLAELTEDKLFKVYYVNKDTGPYSKNTCVSHIEMQI